MQVFTPLRSLGTRVSRVMKRQNLWLFLLAGMFLGLTSGMFDTTFNNFLNDTYRISAGTRGWLEFPRELPGFLVAVFSGMLFFLAEAHMASLAVMLLSLGLVGLAFFAPTFGWLLPWMVVQSTGAHLYMPISQTLGVAVAEKDQVGRRLGQLGAVNIAATVAGSGLVWLGLEHLNFGYRTIFLLAAVSAMMATASLWKINLHNGEVQERRRMKFVFKRRYKLFYALNVLFGARKQVFLTFAPWVLIKVFGQPASTIAKLWIVSAVLGIGFRPLLGKLIDLLGERAILVGEAVALVFICLGYGYGPQLGQGTYGLWLVYLCFVLDQLLFAVGMARTTYLNKIAESPADLTPTLSLGISIDHAVSMTIPILGGLVWSRYGYQSVFLGAAAIAMVNILAAAFVRTRPLPETTTV
ncbi:MAG: MFS transporter [Syntrophothermus sp.]